MAKFKLDEHERFVVVAYAVITALVVLLVGIVLVETGFFDAKASTGFVPNCVPVDQVCGNKGCRTADDDYCVGRGCKPEIISSNPDDFYGLGADGDNQVIHGKVQEQQP